MIKDEASIKAYINRYFSQDLQYDETIAGAMERKQLQRWLLDWAGDRKQPRFDKPELPGITDQEWSYLESEARKKAFKSQS